MLPDKKREREREKEKKKKGDRVGESEEDEITGALRIYGGSGSCINSTFAQVN